MSSSWSVQGCEDDDPDAEWPLRDRPPVQLRLHAWSAAHVRESERDSLDCSDTPLD
jgi:hypothetical protein